MHLFINLYVLKCGSCLSLVSIPPPSFLFILVCTVTPLYFSPLSVRITWGGKVSWIVQVCRSPCPYPVPQKMLTLITNWNPHLQFSIFKIGSCPLWVNPSLLKLNIHCELSLFLKLSVILWKILSVVCAIMSLSEKCE